MKSIFKDSKRLAVAEFEHVSTPLHIRTLGASWRFRVARNLYVLLSFEGYDMNRQYHWWDRLHTLQALLWLGKLYIRTLLPWWVTRFGLLSCRGGWAVTLPQLWTCTAITGVTQLLSIHKKMGQISGAEIKKPRQAAVQRVTFGDRSGGPPQNMSRNRVRSQVPTGYMSPPDKVDV